MLDTVKFVKQCLNDHANLVDIVMGRPQPLVRQGMELMQNMLNEVFGLPPGPDDQDPVQEFLPEAMQVSESEAEDDNRPDLELASESESEVKCLWETTDSQDLMDIEASEASASESDLFDDDSISEGLDDYADNTSDCSNYSTTAEQESERKLKRKREKARESRDALWRRFGLRVEDTGEYQDDSREEERSRIKHRKKNHNTQQESLITRSTAQDKPSAFRQSTLNFDKVTKNRRLFSRKELEEQGTFRGQEEEGHHQKVEVAYPGSLQRNSKRHFRVSPS